MSLLRKCTSCGLEAHSEIELMDFKKNKHRPYGRVNMCKECHNTTYKAYCKDNPEKKQESSRKDVIKRKEKQKKYYTEIYRNKKLLERYGVDVSWYDIQLLKQEGSCAICNKTPEDIGESLCVDHCHTTGNVRGLLCKQCNLMIGNSNDNIETLLSAIKYLKES